MKKFLVILLLFLMITPAWSADADTTRLVNIRTWVRDLLGTTNANGRWTDGVINSQINLACREYATMIGIGKEDTITTTNGTTDYALNTDFWTIKGVVKLSGGRKVALRPKWIMSLRPNEKAIGEEAVDNHPAYFVIKNQTITLDPAETETTADTLIITYKAYATKLTGDSTISNIRYGGIPVVVYKTLLNCMIANREDQFCQLMIPFIEKEYATIFASVKEQEQSASNFDPNAK
jgi:hypothetical protein